MFESRIINRSKLYISLFRLRLSRTAVYLPRAAVGAVIFLMLLGLGTFGFMKSEELSEDSAAPLKIGVCIEADEGAVTVDMPVIGRVDGARYIRMAVDYVSEMDSVSRIAAFEYCDDESEAVSLLKSGEYAAVAVIPQDFISMVISGNGSPARIIFAGSGVNVSSELFQELVRAGVADVSVAQVGVYAVDEAVIGLLNGTVSLYQTEMELSTEYFSYALDRSAYITHEYLAGVRGLSLIQSYVCTGIMIIMACTAILCVQCLSPDAHGFREVLCQKRISRIADFLLRVLAAALETSAVYACFYILLCMSAMRYTQVAQILTLVTGFTDYSGAGFLISCINVFKGVASMFLAVVINYILAGIIYAVSAGRNSVRGVEFTGMIVLVMIYIVMFFMSGCFTSASQLPDWVNAVGKLLPAHWIRELVKIMIVG